MSRWTITVAIIVTLASPIARPALAKTAGPPPEVGVVNRGVVELETSAERGDQAPRPGRGIAYRDRAQLQCERRDDFPAHGRRILSATTICFYRYHRQT
jgi:hypothetical protein